MADLPRIVAFNAHIHNSPIQYFYEDASVLTLANLDDALTQILSGTLQPRGDSFSRAHAIRQILLGHWKNFLSFCQASWLNAIVAACTIFAGVALMIFLSNAVWLNVFRVSPCNNSPSSSSVVSDETTKPEEDEEEQALHTRARGDGVRRRVVTE
eukprot:GHVS01075983.1.p1 GENE.GHVS01075983.1~~GHVS01075983.1.p1  ORF type:complete len:155 (+),score=22.33 GHVS01075983.1:176-640(+)